MSDISAQERAEIIAWVADFHEGKKVIDVYGFPTRWDDRREAQSYLGIVNRIEEKFGPEMMSWPLGTFRRLCERVIEMVEQREKESA